MRKSISILLMLVITVIISCSPQQGLVGKATTILPAATFSITSPQPILAHSDLTFTFSPPNTNIWAVYQKIYLSSKTNPEQNGWKSYTVENPTLNPSPGWLFIVPSRGINIIKGAIAIPEDLPSGTYTLYLATYQWANNKWTSVQWAKKEINTRPSNYCPTISQSKCTGDSLTYCNQQNLWQQYACPKGCYQKTNTDAVCKECLIGEKQCQGFTRLQECADYQWKTTTCEVSCSSGECITLPAITEPTETDFTAPADEAQTQPIEKKLCDNYEFEKNIIAGNDFSKTIPMINTTYLEEVGFFRLSDGKIVFTTVPREAYGTAFDNPTAILLNNDGTFIKNVSKKILGKSENGNFYFVSRYTSHPLILSAYQDYHFEEYTSDLLATGQPWRFRFDEERSTGFSYYPIGRTIFPLNFLDAARNIYFKYGVSDYKDRIFIGKFDSSGKYVGKFIPEVPNNPSGSNPWASIPNKIWIDFNPDGTFASLNYWARRDPPGTYAYVADLDANLNVINQLQLQQTIRGKDYLDRPIFMTLQIQSFKTVGDNIVILHDNGILIFDNKGNFLKEILTNPSPSGSSARGFEDTSVLFKAKDFDFDEQGNMYILLFNQDYYKGGYGQILPRLFTGLYIRKYRCLN